MVSKENQILYLQEVKAFNSDSFFDAESVHFTEITKYDDPTSYADSMSRPDAKLWKEAFDKAYGLGVYCGRTSYRSKSARYNDGL